MKRGARTRGALLVLSLAAVLVFSGPDASGAAEGASSHSVPVPYAGIGEGARRIRTHLVLYARLSSLRRLAFDLDPVLAGALDSAWLPLIERLESDGFDGRTLRRAFARLGPDSYTPAFMGLKVGELHGVFGIGIRRTALTTPLPPPGYSPPVKDTSLGSVLAFMKCHADTLAAVTKLYGVEAESIMGILLMETALGLTLGADPALRSLGAMAATNNVERLGSRGNQRQTSRVRGPRLAATLTNKSEWAYEELKALLRYAETVNAQVWTIPGSFYGAIGLCQFMPSSIERFGADGDGDGTIDPFSVPDALYSVAAYLEANGWRAARSESARHAVIMTYNLDSFYASGVLATTKRIVLAQKGKVSLKAQAVAGGMRVPSARLDPSLRRLKTPPPKARVKSLSSYQEILQ